MEEEKRKRYQLLKEINRKKIKESKWKEDILFNECIESLDKFNMLSLEESQKIISIMENSFPITPWGSIDWKKVNNGIKLNNKMELVQLLRGEDMFYILWDKQEIPCIICKLSEILKCMDDVLAVSFNTWLLSMDGKEIVEFYHEGTVTYGKLK